MSGFDPKRTSTLICAPKLTILRAISDVVTAYHCTARRFSLFIFIVSLSPSQGNAAERDFARAGNKFDETVFHLCSVFNLGRDRKSTRLNSSHLGISYAVFCLKKK